MLLESSTSRHHLDLKMVTFLEGLPEFIWGSLQPISVDESQSQQLRNKVGGHLAISHRRTEHRVKQTFGKSPMPYTTDTFRNQSRGLQVAFSYFSLQRSWGDPHHCVGDRGRICGTHTRKRNSTGQSPAARKAFGGAGDGGAAAGAGRQDPKRMGAVRRLGEVPGAILAQASGESGAPVPGPRTCPTFAQAEG